jgi:hypothetical protein
MENYIKRKLDAKLEDVKEPDESMAAETPHRHRGTAIYELPEDDNKQEKSKERKYESNALSKLIEEQNRMLKNVKHCRPDVFSKHQNPVKSYELRKNQGNEGDDYEIAFNYKLKYES